MSRFWPAKSASAIYSITIGSNARLARIAAGSPLPGESATRDADGNLISFTQSFQNTGTQKVRGADFGLVYQLQTSFGTWTSNAQATFLDSYQFSSTPGERQRELRSSPIDDFSDDAYLKWKGISRLDWAWQGFGVAATARYRDGFHEFDVNGNEHWVKQTWFFDLQASYEFRVAPEKEGELGTGIVNGWPTWKHVSTAPASRLVVVISSITIRRGLTTTSCASSTTRRADLFTSA